MSAITIYLREISRTFLRGDATEHTYRPALKTLIEALEPVTATNEPTRIACGAPDFVITRGRVPLGYIETKDLGEPLRRLERTDQLKRYLDSLGNLILTDFLEFRWYVNGEFRHAASFGEMDADGQATNATTGAPQVEELLRAFLSARASVVVNPQELAERLAGLARLVRFTLAEALRDEAPGGPLREQLEGFRAILLPDLTRDRFADVYAQTIVYGLFAARCNAPNDRPFTRERALFDLPRTNPFLRRLFNYLAGPDLDARLDWVVDDVADLLDRTDVTAVLEGFGQRTRRQDPVFHFYETFLATYDRTMREARGVYYTPEPVVSYVVSSVDKLLRDEFSLPEGLAHSGQLPATTGQASGDHKLLILDPAVGTGTFLHEVVAQIELQVKSALGEGAWSGPTGYVAQHLLPRVFGFELLMAPYTVAHMKIGLQLRDSGYGFESDRRLGIYLTNTLETGVAAGDQYQFVNWLRDEAREASAIKRDRPVMVVLGNPPYSGHASNKGAWITGLLKGRDTTDRASGVAVPSYFHIDGQRIRERNPKWLHDDYVKFIRFSQWRIDRTGSGILAFITNHGYLSNPTFRAMRRALMDTFDDIYVLDLHGNVKKKEKAPDGSRDQNVFDIQQGVAIGIFVKHGQRGAGRQPRIFHAHLWGDREIWEDLGEGGRRLVGGKYHFLGGSDVKSTAWTAVSPAAPFFSFVPRNPEEQREWNSGWSLRDVMPLNVLGFQTHRDHFAIDFDREALRARIAALRNSDLSDDAIRQRYKLKGDDNWLRVVRATLRDDREWEQKIIQCLYRPFDVRWCYFSEVVMDRPRREIIDHVMGRENLCLLSSRQTGTPGYRHSSISRLPAESCVVSTKTKEQNYLFPVYRYPPARDLLGERGPGRDGRTANFSGPFLEALSSAWCLTMVGDGVGDLQETIGPEDVAAYIYALLAAPPYRERYAESLQDDFPKIFITESADVARGLIGVGHTLMRLHLLEGSIQTACRLTGRGSRIVERVEFEDSGDETGKVHINDVLTFEPISADVWAYELGGFQACDKWLKERKGRELSSDEVECFLRIVGAIADTLVQMDRLEEILDEAGGLPFSGPQPEHVGEAPQAQRGRRRPHAGRSR